MTFGYETNKEVATPSTPHPNSMPQNRWCWSVPLLLKGDNRWS